MSTIAAFSVTPVGAGDSVGDLVAEAVRVVRSSGLPSETNAMFTNVEGTLEEVMDLIEECVRTVSASAGRVSVVVKLDVRSGPDGRMEEKVRSVERRLSRPPAS